MASQNLTSLASTLNVWLGDESDITFTSSQKTEFISAAIRDEYVYTIDRDSSLTTTTAASYELPSGYSDQIVRVGIDLLGDGFITWLDRDAYYANGGTLYLEPSHRAMPTGKTIIIIAKKKLTTTDTFDENLQNYILHLSMVEAFQYIKSQLTTKFYKNDMTMGEVLSSINYHRQRANEIRGSLENRYEVAG